MEITFITIQKLAVSSLHGKPVNPSKSCQLDTPLRYEKIALLLMWSAQLHAPGQTHSSPQADLISEFPEIFNGQMQGEEFHIQLSDEAKPFCVKTPRAIPFAYRDKSYRPCKSKGSSPRLRTPQSGVLRLL